MRERVGRMVGDAVEGMPWLGTFHAIGAKMLRRHAELVGLQSAISPSSTPTISCACSSSSSSPPIIDEKRWPARSLAGLIDSWKNKGLTPADIDAGESERYANGRGGELYAAYQARLQRAQRLRFRRPAAPHAGDPQDATATCSPTISSASNTSWSTNIRTPTASSISGCACSRRSARTSAASATTTSRSIRGAARRSRTSCKFEKDFPGAKVIRLEQNYRSTPHILAAASGVIANNGGRLGKTLVDRARRRARRSASSACGTAPRKRAASARRSRRCSAAATALDEVAILVRAQHQTREFEDRFIAIGLPYRIVGGFRFYERAEIRDALAYLRVVNQPADDLAFERIVNVPKRGLGDKAVAKIHQLARAEGVPLTVAAARILDTDELTPQARRSARQSRRRYRALARHGATTCPIPNWPARSSTRAAIPRCCRPSASAEAAGRLENLTELVRAMEEYETLGAFLEHVSLVMDNEAQADEAKVTIMTIHAAKGLEFDTVFLAGWEEGVFPSQRALDEGGLASLEEERRLAYVAITRARRRAIILHAANRRIYGQWTSRASPAASSASCPPSISSSENSMSGGASLWRANWSERADPFADVARGTGRGPGWQRAAGVDPRPAAASPAAPSRASPPASSRARASAVSLGNKGRDDLSVGMRVFHQKFGYGAIAEIEGNKLEIDFEAAGRKRVMDSFVSIG